MTQQTKPPLTLEYQSRIGKAKNAAVGGLVLLGGGVGGISGFMFVLALNTSRLFAGSDRFNLLMLAMFGTIAAIGLLMLVCAVLIHRNSAAAARIAHWLVVALVAPMIALFGFLLTERLNDRNNFVIVLCCGLAVAGGFAAVLVELAIVKRAILRGGYL